MTTNDERIAARRCYGFTTNDERITIGDVMAEPLWINGKSFTAYGLVRRGRSLTSQTAFSGQLPYKGSLGRPAANNGRYTQLVYEEWFCDLRTANNDIDEQHFTGFPQRAAQPLLSVPATVLRLPLVGTRRAGKALDGPYSDICDVAAACGLATCEPLHM